MLVARQHTFVGHVGDVLASEVGELPASEAVPSPALQVRGEMRRVVDDLRQVTAIYFCSVLHPPYRLLLTAISHFTCRSRKAGTGRQ